MHDLGVSDELERHEAGSPADVVVLDRVVVAVDGDHDQVSDGADIRQGRGDRRQASARSNVRPVDVPFERGDRRIDACSRVWPVTTTSWPVSA